MGMVKTPFLKIPHHSYIHSFIKKQLILYYFSFIAHICSVILAIAESYSELYQASKMDFFTKTIKSFQLLTIFAKIFILDFWLGSEHASCFLC